MVSPEGLRERGRDQKGGRIMTKEKSKERVRKKPERKRSPSTRGRLRSAATLPEKKYKEG